MALALLFVLGCGRGSSDEQVASGASGLAWVNGEWVEPPFVVDVSDTGIEINGRLIRSFDGPPTTAGGPTGPDPPITSLDVLAKHLIALGGAGPDIPDEAVLADLLETAQALPGVVEVRIDSGELIVADGSGNEESLVLAQPDVSADVSLIEQFGVEAQRLREALDAGDVLLFKDEAGVEVPASEVANFLDELSAVYSVPEGNRGEAMLDVVGSLAIARALLESGPPPETTSRQFWPSPARLAAGLSPGPSPELLVSRMPGVTMGGGASFSVGSHGENRTPSSNFAYLFQPISVEGPGWCAPGPVIKAAKLHGYKVVHLKGKASTIDELVASSGRAGIFWRCAHGSTVEPAKDYAAAEAAAKKYTGRGLKGIHVSVSSPSNGPFHYVSAWPGKGFYQAHWKSANTIAFLATCSGTAIIQDMKPRVGIAVPASCYPYGTTHRKTMEDFWGRLAGTVNNGRARPVGDAFRGTLSNPWQLAGTGNTVLSPAVAEVGPEIAVPVSPSVPIRGFVTFDAWVDQAVLGSRVDRVLAATGACGAKVTERRWMNRYTYEFWFTTAKPGPLTFTVDSTWVTSADDLALKLDGNQDPKNTDHVGPNHDNFVWTVECTTSIAAPTNGVMNPSPTPAGTSPAPGTAQTTAAGSTQTSATSTAGPAGATDPPASSPGTPSPTPASAPEETPPGTPAATTTSSATPTRTATVAETTTPTSTAAPTAVLTPTNTPTPTPTPIPPAACALVEEPPFVAEVEVKPAAGVAGELIAICGYGFLAGESVTVGFVGAILGPAVADDLGSFRIVAEIPADTPAGGHPMDVHGDMGSLVEFEYELVR